MSLSTKTFGSEEAPSPVRNPESANEVDQDDKATRVAAVLKRNEERQIQNMDMPGYIKRALDDDAFESEEGDELDEAETVEKEARANQR